MYQYNYSEEDKARIAEVESYMTPTELARWKAVNGQIDQAIALYHTARLARRRMYDRARTRKDRAQGRK